MNMDIYLCLCRVSMNVGICSNEHSFGVQILMNVVSLCSAPLELAFSLVNVKLCSSSSERVFGIQILMLLGLCSSDR